MTIAPETVITRRLVTGEGVADGSPGAGDLVGTSVVAGTGTTAAVLVSLENVEGSGVDDVDVTEMEVGGVVDELGDGVYKPSVSIAVQPLGLLCSGAKDNG